MLRMLRWKLRYYWRKLFVNDGVERGYARYRDMTSYPQHYDHSYQVATFSTSPEHGEYAGEQYLLVDGKPAVKL